MNNIAGFIQPYQPSVLMPVSAGGKNDTTTMVIIAVVVVVVLFVLYKNYGDDSSDFTQRESYEDKYSCMNDWKVAINPGCPWCIEQKNELAKHFPTFNKFSTNEQVEAVPTWINEKTGQRIPGYQSYEKLTNMFKCS